MSTTSGLDAVETDRLLLRRWHTDDLDALARVFAKPEVWRYPYRRGWTREETAAFLDRHLAAWDTRGWSLWAVVIRAGGTLAGFAGLSVPTFLPQVLPAVEVGWRLDPDAWGHGYATEAGAAALRAGFDELALDEIISIYEPENVASGRVMERLGMSFDHDTTHPERGEHLRVYKLRREDWRG